MAIHGLGRHAVVSGRRCDVIGVVVGTDTNSSACGDDVTGGTEVGAGRRIPPHPRPDWGVPNDARCVISIFSPG
ncbi:MAG TPA: hypothetical protein VGI68_02345 [Mycobacterium sp.]